MKKHLSKKRVVLAAIVAVALAIGSGVAYAYWTSTGTDTGTATAADGGSLSVQVSPVVGLYPGIPLQDVDIVVSNPEDYVQGLSTVAISIDSIDKVGCVATWFVVTDPTVPANTTIPANSSLPTLKGKIQLKEMGIDQNNCKNAVVTLEVNAS